MPRYTPNPANASFGIIVFPKDIYRVELGEPKAFAGKDNKNYGVRFAGKVIEAAENTKYVGKTFMITCYMHTEGAENYSKGIMAAALGARTDDQFNEEFGNLDWYFNPDDNSCGEGWHEMKGKLIDIETGDPQVPENSQTGDLQNVVLKYRVAT